MVSFDELLKFFIKKWKVIVVMAVIFAAVFTGATFVFGEEIVVPDSEEYLEYMEQKDALEEYIEKSVLMQMDFRNVHERTLFLRDISDKELLQNYVSSSEIWEDLPGEIEAQYLIELVTWNENPETGTIELLIRHMEEIKCQEYMEYLKQKIIVYDQNITISEGAKNLVSDDTILDHQLDADSILKRIEEKIEAADAGYKVTIDKKATLLMGVLVGGFFSLIILFFVYLVKVISLYDLKNVNCFRKRNQKMKVKSN